MLSVEAHSLSRKFGHVHAVRELDLSIEQGSVYALMGPNGAGKSTLIKLLMNLISPTSGHAQVLGMKSETLRGRRLEKIGYVSENQKLPEWMTVEQYLNFCLPFYPTWDRELERRLSKSFELKQLQRVKRLSRGLRMKLALVSALAFRPELLILDEPLSGLDPLVRDELLVGLNELKGRTTILISSHDLAEIDSFASHVGYLDAGRLLLSTTMDNLRQRFKRVEVTFTGPAGPPIERRPEWMNFVSTEAGASWAECNFDVESSSRIARTAFPGAAISVSQLGLREVFLAMARAQREAKGGAH